MENVEEKLLKILKMANELSNKQDKVFALITYYAEENKKIEISIRDKNNYSYKEKCEIYLREDEPEQLKRLDDLIELFNKYIEE